MSLLGDIFGGVLVAGGIVGAPFTGGASLGLVGAGAGLLAGSMASDASQHAADQQVASNQQALTLQQQQHAEAVQRLAPYQQGGAALNALNRPVTSSPMGGTRIYGANYGPRPLAPNASAANYGQPGGNSMNSGGMVTLRAPTGEVRQVPQSQAQGYIQRGATVVGS